MNIEQIQRAIEAASEVQQEALYTMARDSFAATALHDEIARHGIHIFDPDKCWRVADRMMEARGV